MTVSRSMEDMLERERVANRKKHWVRAVTACNSHCLFCLDSDTPRNVYLSEDEVKTELRRGRVELDADKVIISGGEASLHPLFPEFIRYSKTIGYDRVQTVTNGWRFGEKPFYDECIEAGLGEITFSLHGHTAELHDRLTGTEGAFARITKAMARAVRDPRHPIVNIDVVINKQNVGVIDKIVELAIALGITEFDLLHVIPQANAFDHRDELFYDPREHLDRLQKVFRLNRHPRFVVWTNRFPISFLEGMEDLIQDPHKMLDEVNGRRFQVRRYLDAGPVLDCRQPERCKHCFIEPFCTTMDRVVEAQNENRFEVWWIGADEPGPMERSGPLPYGSALLGVLVPDMDALARLEAPAGAGIYARVAEPGPIPGSGSPRAPGSGGPLGPLRLVADTARHLDAWLPAEAPPAEGITLQIDLNRETAGWMLRNRARVAAALDRVSIHQPSHEHLSEATDEDVRDPEGFFRALSLRVRTSGLPACLAPGTVLVAEPRILRKDVFDPATGRLAVRELARHHVRDEYRGKSLRCQDCRVNDRCDGVHVNMIRDQGLRILEPLTEGAWADDAAAQLEKRWPVPPRRLADGRPAQPPAKSLPGFPDTVPVVEDPLAVIGRKQQEAQLRRGAIPGRPALAGSMSRATTPAFPQPAEDGRPPSASPGGARP
jgi:MoaA/NifB/PqqE/SkfB family radical SAM enzyme